MSYKVCLPTAGTGSRLNELTKYLNKSLIDVENKPIISYVLERFPKDSRFVIPLGYKGELVKDYLNLVYPKKNFDFVDVFPYEGLNSGLGYTLLKCKSLLQEPFVFIPCDALIRSSIPDPSNNWMGYSDLKEKSQYRTISFEDGLVKKINEKSTKPSENDYVYIGLSGINDYKSFWEYMENNKLEAVEDGEVFGMRALLRKKVKAIKIDWSDIGNTNALRDTRKKYKTRNSPVILDKKNEKIWFVGNKVIKFSTDKNFILNRVKRSNNISQFIPKILSNSQNIYVYKKVDGEVLSKIINTKLFSELLKTSEIFWKSFELKNMQKKQFKKICLSFYKEKTLNRIEKFFKIYGKKDSALVINGIETPKLNYLLKKLDWNYLSDGIPVRYHGDFHFENIIYNIEKNKFFFLDWRQDFGGIIDYGDLYYDLAKLYHGIIVNHGIINENLYEVKWDNEICFFDFHRKNNLVYCEDYLKEWLTINNYDYDKVEKITALIFLNIAALHHYPYSQLLFLLGKFMLFNNLKL